MPGQEQRSSEKRRAPSERSWTSRAVHFEPMISAARATEHAWSWTAFIVRVIAIQSVLARVARLDPVTVRARVYFVVAAAALAAAGAAVGVTLATRSTPVKLVKQEGAPPL